MNVVNEQYIHQYNAFFDTALHQFVEQFLSFIKTTQEDVRYFFVGNGASAAVASHIANDFSKALGIRASTFHDPVLLTCFGNDYGYDNWVAEAVKLYGNPNDVLILISSSGRSTNIVNAAKTARSKGLKVIALTGPHPDPALVAESEIILRVESHIYNIIECSHMIALCAVVDSCKMVTLQHYPQESVE